jgi:Hsp70 protein
MIEWFKTLLDEQTLRYAQTRDPDNCARSIQEVEQWYTDYMSHLYQHIQLKLGSVSELPSNKSWETAMIEFIFSVPTTWPPSTVERFRSILVRAGYNRHPTHSIAVSLTEAEAAAVYASIDAPEMFRKDEILLVCDIGGGTTDVSVLKITDIAGGSLTLKQLDVVLGRNIGSTKIDTAFYDLMVARLQEEDKHLPSGIDPDSTAWRLMKSMDFQNAKCDFGSPDDPPVFSFPLSGIYSNYVKDVLNMSQSSIQFTAADFRSLFDDQVRLLVELIDKQITRFQNQFASEHISHLVVSGGLGNSAYVQLRLRERYADGDRNVPAAQNIKIHVTSDPQLAVCKGIVMDRVHKLTLGRAVLGWRCCRASYGLHCKELYNKNKPDHVGRQPERDIFDGKKYVDAVRWFIKKGEPANLDTPISHAFYRKLTPQDNNRVFETKVVMSYLESDDLPLQRTAGEELSWFLWSFY